MLNQTPSASKNLRARYKRLTFWEKTGFWGSIMGISSFLIYLITFLIPQETSLPVDADAIISKLETSYKEQFSTFELQQYQQQTEDWKQQIQDAVIALKNIRGQPDTSPDIDKALALLKQGNTAAAETIFQKLEKRKTAEGQTASREAATAARHLGALAFLAFLHNTPKALNAYRRATQLDPNNASGWNQLGHLLRREGLLEQAEAAYQRVLALSSTEEMVASAYANLGIVYRNSYKLAQAEAMHRKSLALNETLGRKAGMASAYTNLGVVYEFRGEPAQAEAMYRKSLAIDEALGRQEGMASAYTILGNLYQTRGELAQAEAMYRKGLAIKKALGRKAGMAYYYSNLGKVYRKRGELAQAEAMYRKGLAIYDALGNKGEMAYNYRNLGKVYQTRGELGQAEVMYRKSLALSQEIGSGWGIKRAQELLETLR